LKEKTPIPFSGQNFHGEAYPYKFERFSQHSMFLPNNVSVLGLRENMRP
jgi:hypothetical protein